jgi:hypothetical protein
VGGGLFENSGALVFREALNALGAVAYFGPLSVFGQKV